MVNPYSARAADVWTSLPAPSFFTSWGWIGTWLAALPHRNVQLVVLREGSHVVAAGCLGELRTFRRGVVPIRSLHLNSVGIERFDDLIIEYNGFTGREPRLLDLLDRLAGELAWDELVLPGVRESSFGGIADLEGRYRLVFERRSPVRFVDLEASRAKGYLAQLSSNTRQQVKRAQKIAGAVTLDVARDPAEAIAVYDELRVLHTAMWRDKGHPGAFTDPWVDRFHRQLIASRFSAGEIQLLRVRTGAITHGCLYNFVWRGRVLQYQTGFRPAADSKDKPGYVCHTAAIEHCAASGLSVYDFLAGDHRYKDSLSTGNAELVWCKVQRPRWRFALEDRLVDLVRHVRRRSP